ncbi:hypothetical protein HU17_16285 [Listeria monocytogenes]|nr:hypothetical protein [Listeria monocytogenes]
MITSTLKQYLVAAYQTKLNKILLNGEIIVLSFNTSIEQEQLVVQFSVPDGVTEIKTIAFYENEHLLAEHPLYVPILTDTLFKYKVEVSTIGENMEK